jgi:amino-acid N-acetyltransferase
MLLYQQRPTTTRPTIMRFGDLRGILQYVPQFRGKTFVVAVDGAVVASENFANVLLDLAVLQSLSVKVALVHGASHQISELAGRRGVEIGRSDGSGPTDAATLEISVDAITRLTHSILQSLQSVDLRAATANALHAHPAGVVRGEDQLFTGRVTRIDAESLRTMLGQGIMPVMPPLGAGPGGTNLRLHSDAVAMEVAVALRAEKLIFLAATPVPFLSPESRHLAVGVDEVDTYQAKVGEPWTSRLRFAREACKSGVARTHMLHGLHNEALLAELFSNEGVGLMVFADDYLTIRPIEGWDIPEILSMIRDSVEDDALVQRQREDIEARRADFRVIEVDENVVGTAALHAEPGETTGEIACVFVKRNHENQGYARRLVRHLEDEARKRGLVRVVALSTQARDFFTEKCGFRAGTPADLPPRRAAKLAASGRNSFVLLKDLTPPRGL